MLYKPGKNWSVCFTILLSLCYSFTWNLLYRNLGFLRPLLNRNDMDSPSLPHSLPQPIFLYVSLRSNQYKHKSLSRPILQASASPWSFPKASPTTRPLSGGSPITLLHTWWFQSYCSLGCGPAAPWCCAQTPSTFSPPALSETWTILHACHVFLNYWKGRLVPFWD